MGSERVRYALGDLGKLFAFTGGNEPAGTTPLTEENDASLTAAGKKYCEDHKLNQHPETIRVLFGQQSSYAVGNAVEASIKNQESRMDRDAKSKAISERLRLDWQAQDKSYQEAVKKR